MRRLLIGRATDLGTEMQAILVLYLIKPGASPLGMLKFIAKISPDPISIIVNVKSNTGTS